MIIGRSGKSGVVALLTLNLVFFYSVVFWVGVWALARLGTGPILSIYMHSERGFTIE
jgi:hypothetical protein